MLLDEIVESGGVSRNDGNRVGIRLQQICQNLFLPVDVVIGGNDRIDAESERRDFGCGALDSVPEQAEIADGFSRRDYYDPGVLFQAVKRAIASSGRCR